MKRKKNKTLKLQMKTSSTTPEPSLMFPYISEISFTTENSNPHTASKLHSPQIRRNLVRKY